MAIDTITVRLTDGIRYDQDYAPNRVYDITAILSYPTNADLAATIAMIRNAGEAYLHPGSNDDAARQALQDQRNLSEERTQTSDKPARKPRTPKPAADPMAEEPVVVQPEEPIVAEVITKDDLSDVLGEATIITDEQMGAAVRRRNGELGPAGPPMIRTLLNTYNPEPESRVFQLKELPQPVRQEFLDKLNALVAP